MMLGKVLGINKTLNSYLRDQYVKDVKPYKTRVMLYVNILTGEKLIDRREEVYWKN